MALGSNIGNLFVEIGADIKDFQKKANEVEKRFSGLKAAAGKMQAVGAGLTAGLSLPIAAIGASIIKTSADFETAMNRVQAVSGATESEFKKLTEQAKELGASTVFSATEAAGAQAFLAQAGFKTQEIMSALSDVLELAVAGQLGLARSADITSNIMGQFGISADNASRVTNVLAATASSSNTNIEQLSEAMKFLGPNAKSMGISLEESAAAIGVLGDAGIQGTLAGQAFGTSLVRLTQDSGRVKDEMDKLGLRLFDVEGNFIGLKETIRQINSATANYTSQQKAATLQTIFGAQAYQEISVLLERGADAFGSYTESITGTSKASEIAKVQSKGFNFAVKGLQSAFEGLQIAIAGSGLIDFATDIANSLASLLRRLSQLNPTVLKAITIFAAFVAAIGPVLLALGSLGAAIPVISGGLTALATLSFPAVIAGLKSMTVAALPLIAKLLLIGTAVAAAIAALTGLIVIVKNIISNWDVLKKYFQRSLVEIEVFFKRFAARSLEAIQPLLDTLGFDIQDSVTKANQSLEQANQKLATTPPMTFAVAMGTIAKSIGEDFEAAKDEVTKNIDKIKDKLDTDIPPPPSLPTSTSPAGQGGKAPAESPTAPLLGMEGEGIGKGLDQYIAKLGVIKETTSNLNEVNTEAESILAGVINQFGKSASAAVEAGKGFESFARSAGNAIRDVISGLLSEVVALAVRNALSSPAVQALGPAGVAIAGAAGAAASSLFKALVPSFASGGIISGETFARVGEYTNAKTNPEVIAPLDRLQGMLAGQGEAFDYERFEEIQQRNRPIVNVGSREITVQRGLQRTTYMGSKMSVNA